MEKAVGIMLPRQTLVAYANCSSSAHVLLLRFFFFLSQRIPASAANAAVMDSAVAQNTQNPGLMGRLRIPEAGLLQLSQSKMGIAKNDIA